MNSDTLLTHIRLEQRCLIDIDKKLHELECLLSCSDPIRFFEVAKNMALLSERSTAQLRNFLFSVCGGMPQDYYLQAAKMHFVCYVACAVTQKDTHRRLQIFAASASCGTKAVCRTTKSSPLPRMYRLHRTCL